MQKHHDISFKKLEIRKGHTLALHISLFVFTLKRFWHHYKSMFCMLSSLRVMLKCCRSNTQGNNIEACELWSLIRRQVIRTCRWHASSIISVLSITYTRYSHPALINRCDLTELITHEPSLIRSLFPSDPGDRSSSHIPPTLETLSSPFRTHRSRLRPICFCFFFCLLASCGPPLSRLKTNTWLWGLHREAAWP